MSARSGGSDEGSGGGALGVAILATLAGITALIAAVAVFGSPGDGQPSVSLDIVALAPAPESQLLSANARIRRYAGETLVADPALLEATEEGLVPRITADGRTAIEAYGNPFDPAETRPRIAIVVLGVGIDPISSALALSRLPPQVSIAVAPFVPNGQDIVDAARRAGHEVLVEVPMETEGEANTAPGLGVLLLGANEEENTRRLNWALSRFTGYVGVTNLLGGQFLEEETSMVPFLTTLTNRGLLFLDGGSYPRSIALDVAARTQTTSAGATMVLDTVQQADSIQLRLQQLEEAARAEGYAVGVAAPFIETADVIARWAVGLGERGMVLAPISAVARVPAPVIQAAP